MPQRFLRPGIRHSERWNSVSFEAQSLYIRILTLVDDYGRYDGRASVLWGECFAVWNELHPKQCVTLAATSELLQQLAASRLVDIYSAKSRPGEISKQVLQILQWEERIRDGSKEKWPKNDNPQQSAATCSVLLPPPPSPPPSPTPPPNGNGGYLLPPESKLPFRNEAMLRFDKMWSRRRSTAWSQSEIKSLKTIEPINDEDFKIVEKYYSARLPVEKDYRRKDLSTLLNNWNGEVDRAKKFKPPTPL